MAANLRIWLAALFLALPLAACAMGSLVEPAPGAPVLFPANGAQNVNPDTHLVLTFASSPTIGTSGPRDPGAAESIRSTSTRRHWHSDTTEPFRPCGAGRVSSDDSIGTTEAFR